MKLKKLFFTAVAVFAVLTLAISAAAIGGILIPDDGDVSYTVPLRVGDTDLNGKSNILDMVMLKKYLVKSRVFDKIQEKEADLNGDGYIDADDLAVLRGNLLGGIEYGDNVISVNKLTGGTVYYVSADGTSMLGTSPEEPLSLETANSKLYSKADTVLFRKNDIFYSTVNLKVNPSDAATGGRLKISSYGNGDMPVFSGAAVVTDTNAFKPYMGIENYIYTLDLTDKSNFAYGYISGNGTENIGFITDGKNIYGDRKDAVSKLSNQYDFCISDGTMYVLCSDNPVVKMKKVSLATCNNLMIMNSNTEISDLRFTLCGTNCLAGGSETVISNVKIKNCIIENIGGSLHYENDAQFVRLGNGIEFYNKTVKNVTVEQNIVRNCYDVAFTIQGNSSDCSGENIKICNNCFYSNKQSNEIFIENAGSMGIKNYVFSNNICINSGRNWGNFTSNPKNGVPCEFLFYNFYPSTLDMTVSDNIIFNCMRLYWWNSDDTSLFTQGVKSKNNKLYIPEFALHFKNVTTLSELQNTYNKEIGSQYFETQDISGYNDFLDTAATANDADLVFKAFKNID